MFSSLHSSHKEFKQVLLYSIESKQKHTTANLELPDDEHLNLLKSHVDTCFGCRVTRKECRQTDSFSDLYIRIYRFVMAHFMEELTV